MLVLEEYISNVFASTTHASCVKRNEIHSGFVFRAHALRDLECSISILRLLLARFTHPRYKRTKT